MSNTIVISNRNGLELLKVNVKPIEKGDLSAAIIKAIDTSRQQLDNKQDELHIKITGLSQNSDLLGNSTN